MQIDETVDLLQESEKTVAFTGAGISAESGVPTFRGEGGLWKEYSPTFYANPIGLFLVFLISPKKVANFGQDVFETIFNAKPNLAHSSLAELEGKGFLSCTITQNIDNLHQEAGAENVIELHGNIYRVKCIGCGKKYWLEKDEIAPIFDKLKTRSRFRFAKRAIESAERCECGRICRPDVVLFGESLPKDSLEKAIQEIRSCDLLLMVGTSGVVYPAASLPPLAGDGTKIVEVNPEASSLSHLSDIFIQGNAGEVLPKIVSKLGFSPIF